MFSPRWSHFPRIEFYRNGRLLNVLHTGDILIVTPPQRFVPPRFFGRFWVILTKKSVPPKIFWVSRSEKNFVPPRKKVYPPKFSAAFGGREIFDIKTRFSRVKITYFYRRRRKFLVPPRKKLIPPNFGSQNFGKIFVPPNFWNLKFEKSVLPPLKSELRHFPWSAPFGPK